jgi:hypothetical protein
VPARKQSIAPIGEMGTLARLAVRTRRYCKVRRVALAGTQYEDVLEAAARLNKQLTAGRGITTRPHSLHVLRATEQEEEYEYEADGIG